MTFRNKSCVIGRGEALFSIWTGNGIGLEDADPDFEDARRILVAEHDDWRAR